MVIKNLLLITDFRFDPISFQFKAKKNRNYLKKNVANFLWYLQESNQGHMDFQSIALPTELRYQFVLASANIV